MISLKQWTDRGLGVCAPYLRVCDHHADRAQKIQLVRFQLFRFFFSVFSGKKTMLLRSPYALYIIIIAETVHAARIFRFAVAGARMTIVGKRLHR